MLKGDLKKQAILETAEKLFFEKGYSSATIDDILEVLGCSKGSLYHHFECAVYMHGVSCLEDIRKDFSFTLNKCRKVTYETIKKERIYVKLVGAVIKLFAPLL